MQQFSAALQNLLTALVNSAKTALASTKMNVAALLPLQMIVQVLQTQVNTLFAGLGSIVGATTGAVANQQAAASSALSGAVQAL